MSHNDRLYGSCNRCRISGNNTGSYYVTKDRLHKRFYCSTCEAILLEQNILSIEDKEKAEVFVFKKKSRMTLCFKNIQTTPEALNGGL